MLESKLILLTLKNMTAVLKSITLCDCSIREYRSFYCFAKEWCSLHQNLSPTPAYSPLNQDIIAIMCDWPCSLY